MVCVDMEYLGIQFDEVKNELNDNRLRELNFENSKVKILVIPTNEELEIANQCFNLLK